MRRMLLFGAVAVGAVALGTSGAIADRATVQHNNETVVQGGNTATGGGATATGGSGGSAKGARGGKAVRGANGTSASQSGKSSSSVRVSITTSVKTVHSGRGASAHARGLLKAVRELARALRAGGVDVHTATSACAILASVRTQVAKRLDALVARFPKVAARLRAARRTALGVIARQRAAFDCG